MAGPRNTKAPAGGAAGALMNHGNKSRKCTDNRTDTAAQERRIVAALRLGPKSTDDLRALGCYQVSARIFGPRRKGYNIVTDLLDGYAADGMHHAKMARYALIGEPEGGAA